MKMTNRFDVTLDDLLRRPSSSGRSAYRCAPFTNPKKFKNSSSSLSDCKSKNCNCCLFNKKIPNGNHGTAPGSSNRNKSKAGDESRRNTLKKYFKSRKSYFEKKLSNDRLNCYSSNSTSSGEDNFLPSRNTRLAPLKDVLAKDGVIYSDESITDQQCRHGGILNFDSNNTTITRDELDLNEEALISLKEIEVNSDLSAEFNKEKRHENPLFSQEKHTTDYQQLLENDLDIFKTLIYNNNNNRNILDLLCSIHTSPDLPFPSERNDQPRKLLQLKYVREVDRSQSSIINRDQERKRFAFDPIEIQSYRKVTEFKSSQDEEEFVCLHNRGLIRSNYKFQPVQSEERFISQSTSTEPQLERNNSEVFEILDNGLHSQSSIGSKSKFQSVQSEKRFISQKSSTSTEPQLEKNNSEVFEILDNGLHSQSSIGSKSKFQSVQSEKRFISQKPSTAIESQSQRNNSEVFEILYNGNREEKQPINYLPLDFEIDNINEDKIEATKILILEDITLKDGRQIYPIDPVNRESDCKRKTIRRTPLDADKEIGKLPNYSKRGHILKQKFTQILSTEDGIIGRISAVDYDTNIEYLKEFIEDKLQDITQYLYRYQSKLSDDTNDNRLNNIILSSFNDPIEENLLKSLESQDIYSQSLTFTPVLINRSDMKVSQTNTSQSWDFDRPSDEMLINSIDGLLNDKSLICQGAYDIQIPEDVKKMFILRSLSDFFMKILDDIRNERIPILNIRNQRNWCNCAFDQDNLLLKPAPDASNTKVSIKGAREGSKFNLILFLIGKITNLLINNSFCTKRELYYQLKDFIKNQLRINTAIDAISCLFDEPAWEFGVVATSKGLIYGDLTITFSEKQILNCNMLGGSLIPQNIHKITKLESNASFILVVEKDSIFQKLLDEDLPNQLPRSFIMITGKGYPDINTRLLVKKLWQILYVPVFLLADADPYGIEIMLCYKFGSKSLCHLSEYLAVPSLRWIGLHPKEIISLNVTRQPLTEKETKRIRSLLDRPYSDSIPKIKEELEVMLGNNFKAEIEGIMKSNNYLTNFYIPGKLCARDFL